MRRIILAAATGLGLAVMVACGRDDDGTAEDATNAQSNQDPLPAKTTASSPLPVTTTTTSDAASPPSPSPDAAAPKGMTCSDKVKNGNETDVDCGGDCGPCGDLSACKVPLDCASNTCTNGVCISCVDKVKDGSETDVDCGGSCGTCANGKACTAATDCASNTCANGVCCTNVTTNYKRTGLTACCDDGDTLVAVGDCGTGYHHSAVQSSALCGIGLEGRNNYGNPCAIVSCDKVTCVP